MKRIEEASEYDNNYDDETFMKDLATPVTNP